MIYTVDGTGRRVFGTYVPENKGKSHRALIAEFHEAPGIDPQRLAYELKGALEAESASFDSGAPNTDKGTDTPKKRKKTP